MAGNITTINEKYVIDFKAPRIHDCLNGNIYTIDIDEKHILSLQVRITNKNGEIQTTNNQHIQLADGVYLTEIICLDQFEHLTKVNNEFIVDTVSPSIRCSLKDLVITQPNWNVELEVEDVLLKSWSYVLKRNNQIIDQSMNETTRCLRKEYNETQFIDDGNYELECVAYDLSGKKTIYKQAFNVITKNL